MYIKSKRKVIDKDKKFKNFYAFISHFSGMPKKTREKNEREKKKSSMMDSISDQFWV